MPSACPSVPKEVTILAFDGFLIENGHVWSIYAISIAQKLDVFRNSLGPLLKDDVVALILLGFQILTWNFVEHCTVSWSRSPLKMAMIGQFCALSRQAWTRSVGRCCRSNYLRISYIGLTFGGLMHTTKKNMVMPGQFPCSLMSSGRGYYCSLNILFMSMYSKL